MKKKLFFIILFLLTIYLPIFQHNFNFIDIDTLDEKREKEQFPKIENPTDIFTQEYLNKVKKYYEDNFGFRDLLIKTNNTIDYNIFKVSPSDRVIIGKEDWLFYRDTLKDYQGNNLLTIEQIKLIAKKLEDFNSQLASEGIEFVFFIGPNKNSIYPEYMLDKYIQDNNDSNYARLLVELSKTDVKYIDTKKILLNNKEEYLLYYKRDTHWNENGAYIVSKEILKLLSEEYNISLDYPIITEYRSLIRGGDLNNMLGIYVGEVEETIPVINYPSNNQKLPKTLFYGDSFRNKVIPNINPYTDELKDLHIHKESMNQSLRSIVNEYDVVIMEIVERNLQMLLKYEFPAINTETIYTYNYLDKNLINVVNCEIIYEEDYLKIVSKSRDPHFELPTVFSFENDRRYYVEITMSSEINSTGQIFYRNRNEKYNEENSIKFNLEEGENIYILEISSDTERIRIDPIIEKGEVIIKNITILIDAQ